MAIQIAGTKLIKSPAKVPTKNAYEIHLYENYQIYRPDKVEILLNMDKLMLPKKDTKNTSLR